MAVSFDTIGSTIITSVVSAIAGAMLPLSLAFINRGPALQRIVTGQMEIVLKQKDDIIKSLQDEASETRKRYEKIKEESDKAIADLVKEYGEAEKRIMELTAQNDRMQKNIEELRQLKTKTA